MTIRGRILNAGIRATRHVEKRLVAELALEVASLAKPGPPRRASGWIQDHRSEQYDRRRRHRTGSSRPSIIDALEKAMKGV